MISLFQLLRWIFLLSVRISNAEKKTHWKDAIEAFKWKNWFSHVENWSVQQRQIFWPNYYKRIVFPPLAKNWYEIEKLAVKEKKASTRTLILTAIHILTETTIKIAIPKHLFISPSLSRASKFYAADFLASQKIVWRIVKIWGHASEFRAARQPQRKGRRNVLSVDTKQRPRFFSTGDSAARTLAFLIRPF